jgi:GTP pyrophosphokinase
LGSDLRFSFHRRPDGRELVSRSIGLACSLADLQTYGIPAALDRDALAACLLIDSVECGSISIETVEARLGDEVASIITDCLRIKTAPSRVELYDDVASSAIREWCLAFHDVRSSSIEVLSRLDNLLNMSILDLADQQIVALEALQVFAPLGHSLGLGHLSSQIEDIAFRVIFPQSYSATESWVKQMVTAGEEALFAAQRRLLSALDDRPSLVGKLTAGFLIKARTKSLFSVMKKVLRMDKDWASKGARKLDEIYDLLGMRVIVQPLLDLPAPEAESLAEKACFVAAEVAESMWPSRRERKDYISSPKENGYQSLHCVLELSVEEGSRGSEEPLPLLELQIRTTSMDDRAEAGEAAHTAYKGGLTSSQAKQIREWTNQIKRKISADRTYLSLPTSTLSSLSSLDESDISPATRALFNSFDSDRNGMLDLGEIKDQLRDLLGGGSSIEEEAEDSVAALLEFLEAEDDAERGCERASFDPQQGLSLQQFNKLVKKVSGASLLLVDCVHIIHVWLTDDPTLIYIDSIMRTIRREN